MKTVILKWNPAISSYSLWMFLNDLINCYNGWNEDFDWSVWDFDKIHKGDRVYWVKVGQYGQTGIVGRGEVTSEPREGEDWSGQGRKTYYVDFSPDFLVNPDALPILTTDELQEFIKDFEWNNGHSGLVLTDEQAAKLESLWEVYVDRNQHAFKQAESLPRGDYDLIYMA